jgi:hypothetical protein
LRYNREWNFGEGGLRAAMSQDARRVYFKWPWFQTGCQGDPGRHILQDRPLPLQPCRRPATRTPASTEAPATPTTTPTRASARAGSTADTARKVRQEGARLRGPGLSAGAGGTACGAHRADGAGCYWGAGRARAGPQASAPWRAPARRLEVLFFIAFVIRCPGLLPYSWSFSYLFGAAPHRVDSCLCHLL